MTEKNMPLLFLSRRQFHKFACEGKVNVSVDPNAALDAAKHGLTNPPNILVMLTASWVLPIVFVVLAIAAHPGFLLLALPPLYLVKIGREKCRAALLQKCFENDKVYDVCIKNMHVVITSDDPEVIRADMINSIDGIENADKEIEVESFIDSFVVTDGTEDDDELDELMKDPYAIKVISTLSSESPQKFLKCIQSPFFVEELSEYIAACKKIGVTERDCIVCVRTICETNNNPIESAYKIEAQCEKMK